MYKKELRKVMILLSIGVILAIGVIINGILEYGVREIGSDFLEIDSYIVLIGVICYPLGLAYGWKQMFKAVIFMPKGSKPARYYHYEERVQYKQGRFLGWLIKGAFVLAFGWIYGTLIAIKKLRELKRMDSIEKLSA